MSGANHRARNDEGKHRLSTFSSRDLAETTLRVRGVRRARLVRAVKSSGLAGAIENDRKIAHARPRTGKSRRGENNGFANGFANHWQ